MDLVALTSAITAAGFTALLLLAALVFVPLGGSSQLELDDETDESELIP
jgi:hypothetical protein